MFLLRLLLMLLFFFFFFNDTATTEIYTLSLHDALPILVRFIAFPPDGESGNSWGCSRGKFAAIGGAVKSFETRTGGVGRDRKSTRLNSSHLVISYAVFCLKKKKKNYL